MLLAIALTTMTALCRPADLSCRDSLPAAELAINEVPDFLPESHECWMDGPCANPLLMLDAVRAYVRDVSPALQVAKLPDALLREARREVETYHHRCNLDIKANFARSFSEGDFRPSFRGDYKQATEEFFRTVAWRSMRQSRIHQTPLEAASPYEPWVMQLPKRLRADFDRFLGSAAGRWWLASRSAAWNRVLRPNTQLSGMCPAAAASFHRQLVGLLVEYGMTDQIIYRASPRSSPK